MPGQKSARGVRGKGAGVPVRRGLPGRLVVETLGEFQLPSPMSRASRDLLEESLRAELAEEFKREIPDNPDDVVRALSRHYGTE